MVIETIFDKVKDELRCQPVGIPLPLTEHVDDHKAACPACDLTLTGKPDDNPISRLVEHFRELREQLKKSTVKQGTDTADQDYKNAGFYLIFLQSDAQQINKLGCDASQQVY